MSSTAFAALPWRAALADNGYDGPFIDAHAHLNWGAGVNVNQLMALYDAAGARGDAESRACRDE
jgi:hypothetical protein